jgi:hypothetical protein
MYEWIKEEKDKHRVYDSFVDNFFFKEEIFIFIGRFIFLRKKKEKQLSLVLYT